VIVQRRFNRQWQKNARDSAKHARLMKRKPELREQLYGTGTRPTDHPSVDASNTRIKSGASRDTAQKGNDDG
jgi:hypothetical protein